jgi:prepilin-type processing-associated H-X9-DG protein
MRQLGLALLNFSTSKNSFPNAGTFGEASGVTAATSNTYNAIYTPKTGDTNSAWLYNWVVDIMPYLDQPDIANAWDRAHPYYTVKQFITGQPSNFTLSNTSLGVLRCPNDTTAQPGQGNLSYVVNGGFVLFTGTATSFSSGQTDPTAWPSTSLITLKDSSGNLSPGVTQRMGVMFLGDSNGNAPWNFKTTPSGISDGASNTLLVSENTLAGYDSGTFTNGIQTNWACPLPTYCMFIGSAHICDGQAASSPAGGSCGTAVLNEINGSGFDSWQHANFQTTNNYDYINYGQQLSTKGIFPFSNSGHPGGCNMVFCDGAVRFISSTISGNVYARMITPAGSRLPLSYRQAPLSQDAFAN